MNRLLVLDSLRGIAAILVVLYHFTFRYRELYGHDFSQTYDISYGYLGVELFFLISGFVIFLTINKTKDWKDFVFKRLSRLYPTYWVCLILTYTVVLIFGLKGREVAFTDFVVNFSMIQQLFKIPNVDGVYWSLFPELVFYVFILVLYILKKIDKVIYIGGVWVLLSFFHLYVYTLHGLGVLLNLKYASFFYIGILFYLLKESTTYRLKIHALLITCMILSIFAFEVNGGIIEKIILLAIYLTFYLFIYDKLNFLINKPLVFLGSISYPLYLLHQNIGYIIINYTRQIIGDSLLVIFLPILLTSFLAYIVTRYIEKPSISFLRKRYNLSSGIREDKLKKMQV